MRGKFTMRHDLGVDQRDDAADIAGLDGLVGLDRVDDLDRHLADQVVGRGLGAGKGDGTAKARAANSEVIQRYFSHRWLWVVGSGAAR